MWLIAGLGNPGPKYRNTPHNLGFEVVDELASRTRARLADNRRWKGETANAVIAGEEAILLKPMTYMNLSGESVVPLAQYSNIPPERIVTVSDDIHVQLGRLRLRSDGSHGGHNGLRNIIAHLGTEAFPRLRVGCKPGDEPIHDWVGFVLRPLWGEAREVATESVAAAADCVEFLLAQGLGKAMGRYNGWKAGGNG